MNPNTKPFDHSAEEIADSHDVVNLQVIEATIADLRKSARTIIKRREDRKARRRVWRQEVLRKARSIWDWVQHYGFPGPRFLSVDVGRDNYYWTDLSWTNHSNDTLRYSTAIKSQQSGKSSVLGKTIADYLSRQEILDIQRRAYVPDHYLRCGAFGPSVEHVRLSCSRWALDNCAVCHSHHERLLAFHDALLDDVWRGYFGQTYVEKTQGERAYELVLEAAWREYLRDGEAFVVVQTEPTDWELDNAPLPERRFIMCGSGV